MKTRDFPVWSSNQVLESSQPSHTQQEHTDVKDKSDDNVHLLFNSQQIVPSEFVPKGQTVI
jgi:hypothetical protein